MGEILRLQKYIAMSGEASRRAAEEMITAGRVCVNGKVCRTLGTKVEIGADKVLLDGREIKPEEKKYYIMLNKPVGYVTTSNDQFERPTVLDLVKTDISARIFPVGRLDYDTEGLLLLTNDGDFAYKVSHPKFQTDKTYVALLKGGITLKGINMLKNGVYIDDKKTSPAEVEIIRSEKGMTEVKITIHEGRNRQVRKMFSSVGAKVAALKRISIGTVELGNLPPGRWRHLTKHEISYLSR